MKIEGITFRYCIGDIINTKHGSYKIIDYKIHKEKSGRTAVYVCQCLNDGYIFERRQYEIDKNIGCPICSHHKIVLGYNTIFDLRPDLIKYFVNIEDTKRYSLYSNEYVWLKCPNCGQTKYMKINSFTIQGFACPQCGDGISYPNKFIRVFLKQLNINFIPEKSFNWLSNRLYDEYLPEYNMIIENHGEQHYDNRNIWGINNKENDNIKRETAIKNNIKYYIELDCSKSNMLYIKNSILNSELPNILNFKEEDINWEECELKASSSLLIEVCNLWNKGFSYEEIMKELNISYDTAHVYLRKGRKIGIANNLEINDHLLNNNIKYTNTYNGTPIYCITDNKYFVSSNLCVSYYKSLGINLNTSNISRAIKNHGKTHNKEFVNISKREFNELKDKSLIDPDIIIYGEKYPEKFCI